MHPDPPWRRSSRRHINCRPAPAAHHASESQDQACGTGQEEPDAHRHGPGRVLGAHLVGAVVGNIALHAAACAHAALPVNAKRVSKAVVVVVRAVARVRLATPAVHAVLAEPRAGD